MSHSFPDHGVRIFFGGKNLRNLRNRQQKPMPLLWPSFSVQRGMVHQEVNQEVKGKTQIDVLVDDDPFPIGNSS